MDELKLLKQDWKKIILTDSKKIYRKRAFLYDQEKVYCDQVDIYHWSFRNFILAWSQRTDFIK